MQRQTLQPKSYPFLILLLSLFAIGPTLSSGYWWGAHDARHAVYFLFEFHQVIQDGVWWPRWLPDFAFGYGYPFFNIYGPLPSYVGEFFHLLGFDIETAVKFSFLLSVLASGLTMYALGRRFLGENGGLVAAVAYVYLPYHLANLYVRAALAESWALVWFPLVFLGFYECVTRPRLRAVAYTAIAYVLLWLSHNSLAVQTTFLLIIWVLFWLLVPLQEENKWFWQARDVLKRRVVGAFTALGASVLGMTLGGIFIFPFALEFNDVNRDQWVQGVEGYFSFSNHFIEPWQLFSPFWGFGTSIEGPNDEFPFQLGIVLVLFALSAWIIPIRDQTVRSVRLFFTIMLLVLLWFTQESSAFLWSSAIGGVILQPMQFPWRFLVLAGFALAFLAGFAARRAPAWVALLLAVIVIAGSYNYTNAVIIEPPEGPVDFAGFMRFQQSAGELTGQSRWVDIEDIPTWSPLADIWVAGGDVTSRFVYEEGLAAGNAVSNSYQEITEVKLDTPRTLRWMITYYPGWRAYRMALEQDEILEELPITPQETTGHLTIDAPAGHFRYMVRFEDTPVRTVGKISSALSLLLVAGLLWRGRKGRKGEEKKVEKVEKVRSGRGSNEN